MFEPDPLTQSMLAYDKWLRVTGRRMDIQSLFPHEPHQRDERALHVSSLMLCDRRACYKIMEDMGEIEVSVTPDPYLQLDFRMGLMMEEWLVEALAFDGSLIEWQTRLSSPPWKGRLDIVARVGDERWLVEVKTVKSGDAGLLVAKFPKDYHIAQVMTYDTIHKREFDRVCLFYMLRATMGTELYSLQKEDGNVATERWDSEAGEWVKHKTFRTVLDKMEESRKRQEHWIDTGELPQRIGSSPDRHPFLCVSKDWESKVATPTCRYFETCWGMPPLPFSFGSYRKRRFFKKEE